MSEYPADFSDQKLDCLDFQTVTCFIIVDISWTIFFTIIFLLEKAQIITAVFLCNVITNVQPVKILLLTLYQFLCVSTHTQNTITKICPILPNLSRDDGQEQIDGKSLFLPVIPG